MNEVLFRRRLRMLRMLAMNTSLNVVIHSARRTHVRDTVMLMEDSDMGKVLTHLRRGKAEVLKKQVYDIIEMLNDEKLVDSLKGVFTLTIIVHKQIVGVRKKMENLSKDLS